MKITAMVKEKYNSRKVLLVEWAIISAVAAFMFIAFYYVDMESLTIWTTYFLDSIFDGRIMDVYQYGVENIYHSSHEYIGTNIFVFIPWAIWNIPIWIMQRFFGLQIVEHSTMLLWSKLFLVLMLLLSAYFAFKIVTSTVEDKNAAWWVVALSLSYPYTYLGVFWAGQSDVISVCWFTAAVYLLIKGKNGWFYLLSSCAIATKPFYLLSYIAVILLLEKNIIRVILKLAAGCGITLVLGLVYSGAPMYQESMENGPMNQMLENILGSGYSSFATTASWLVFALVLIYFLAYLTKTGEENRSNYIVYFIVIPLLVHFMFAGFEHYRMILLSPFLFIMFVQKKEYFRLNMIVNLVVSFCAMFCIINFSKYAFSSEFMDGTFVTNFFGRTSLDERCWYNMQTMFRENINNFEVIVKGLAGAYGGGAVILILLNHPRLKKKFAVETQKCERWILWGNMFLIIPFVILAFVCYYYVK